MHIKIVIIIVGVHYSICSVNILYVVSHLRIHDDTLCFRLIRNYLLLYKLISCIMVCKQLQFELQTVHK